MHISEGVLSVPVLAGGAIVAGVSLTYSLRKLPWEMIMSVAALSAAFFVASLIHVTIGPGSVHLLLHGLLGTILGWAALPAVAVALFLQALFFQFGGLTSLGVNICMLGLPAVAAGALFRFVFPLGKMHTIAAFFCGALPVAASGCIGALALALSGDIFLPSAYALLLAHLPVMGIEGVLTVFAVRFLLRVQPELLALPPERLCP